MAPQQFMNRSFPQPLQLAVWCSYINGIWSLLTPGQGIGALLSILGAIGAWVMVNGKRWGYVACLIAGGALFALYLLLLIEVGLVAGLNLLFAGALVAGLLHPLSRKYVKIWLD